MLATKELLAIMSSCQFDRDVTLTFVGRYKGIISASLAVVEVFGIPFALPPSPFAPMGESISMGVDAIFAGFDSQRLACTSRCVKLDDLS